MTAQNYTFSNLSPPLCHTKSNLLLTTEYTLSEKCQSLLLADGNYKCSLRMAIFEKKITLMQSVVWLYRFPQCTLFALQIVTAGNLRELL